MVRGHSPSHIPVLCVAPPQFLFPIVRAMASIRRLLSLAANEVDEDAAFWTEVRIEALAVELF